MRSILPLSAAAVTLIAAAPVAGQGMDMPMPHPMPAAKTAPKADKAASRPMKTASPVKKAASTQRPATATKPATPPYADTAVPIPSMEHSPPGHEQHAPPAESTSPPVRPGGGAAAGHEMPAMPAMDHAMPGPEAPRMDHKAMGDEMAHAMTGALGPYPMNREASGTAWQPDMSEHSGVQVMAGDWMLMGHAVLNGVYSRQEGPRGGDKTFASGMVMGMAKRDFVNGNALQLRAMLSPDPLMGKSGYPLHLASGETADGVTPLVDRQHPHDLFMELSASYSLRLSDQDGLFLYAGLPGEPAFGPPAFMHRMSIMDSPEAPISHHWLDSTHITFGVVTAGFVHHNMKIEASRFHGREPDEHRYDIETGPLDSTAVRMSWNPAPQLSLQASWAYLKSPEQLEPDANQTRWSASAIYTKRIAAEGLWSTTLAWGRRTSGHEDLDAWVLESAVKLKDWTVFGRAERTENNELVSVAGHHGPTYKVGKLSLGAVRDFRVADHVKFGIGGLYAFNFVPSALEGPYDGDPQGAMAFFRFKIE